LDNIDLMIYPPFPFEQLWNQKDIFEIKGTEIYVACVQDLIALKLNAIAERGLDKDYEDLEALKIIQRRRNEGLLFNE
jgi:hypothetical protein